MVSKKKIKELILEVLENVKSSEPVYKDWILNGEAVVLGTRSPMDSVAFTVFITDLEERIENEIKCQFTLDIEHLYGDSGLLELNLSVEEMAKRIFSTLNSRK